MKPTPLLVLALVLPACSPDAGPQSAAVAPPHASAPLAAPPAAPDAAPTPEGPAQADPPPSPAQNDRSQKTPTEVVDLALLEGYPWLGDGARPHPLPASHLSRRFAPPPGFTRVDLEPGTFGAFLRDLPLAADGTPVVSFRGATILPPGHSNLAAVVAIDTGDADLQQCADSVIRLHAEWRFARGHRDHRYRGASGLDLPLARYLGGERLVFKDGDLSWQDRKKPRRPDHSALRDYLDGVFAWANTGSLANQAKKIARADLRPGDFFVLPGGPGHAVLILDLATGPEGQLALLLGQGFMPAQSIHVLRPTGAPDPWFRVAPADTAVATPFWDPFPWSSLRRLE